MEMNSAETLPREKSGLIINHVVTVRGVSVFPICICQARVIRWRSSMTSDPEAVWL